MYEDIKKQYQELESKLSDPELFTDQEKYIDTTKQYNELKIIIELILKLDKNTHETAENKVLIENELDAEMKKMIAEEAARLEMERTALISEIEQELHPADPLDKKNAILEIRAGTGGDESALFAADLFRMYSNYAEHQGWKLEIMDSSRIGLGGYKEIIFSVTGKNAYGRLKYEAGTHRVQRVPETEKAGRIHTSAATVVVLPEAEEVDIEINPADLRIDTFCSSGPGGQSVNTTYSAIRVVHMPTGTTVSCQDQKSQHQNKEKALQILRSRLLARAEEEKKEKESAERKDQVGSGDRSDKIRTYNFPQDRVTDHRIKMNWHSIDRIMNGEIDGIIDGLKKAAY